MLSIGKVTAGNVEYWEQQVAQGRDDYYSGKGESPGQWSGSGAEALGLAGEVDGDVYRKVIGEGRDPESGERLRSSGRGGGSVLAFDLTFSAPKSVSLLYAVGDKETSEALREAHDEAVAAAMEFMEAEACGVRRGAGGGKRLDGDGFFSAKYRHRMSRAMDPQLHTHCVTANLTRGPDGRVSALDGERLYRQAAAGGHVYQAHLRAAVRERLGWWRWGEVRKGMAELETLEPALLREFSQRRVQIEADLEENGRSRRRSAEKAALATREAKRHELGTEEWSADVRVRAAEHGLGRAELAALTGAPVTAAAAVDHEELSGRLLGPAGLTEMRNAFEHRDAVIAISAAHRDGLAAPRLRRQSAELIRRRGVLTLPSAERRFTTEELLGHERAIVASAKRRGQEQAAPRVSAAAAERALAQGAIALTDEQRAAVLGLATSGRGVESLEALAGTGKTTVAGALRDVFESEGIRVMGVAPTARAARELAERAGIAGATTMARFRIDLERFGEGVGGEGTGAVLIVDEAGMAATRETAAIVAACERANTKVIAIGDPGQLASVQAGGWLGSISQRFGARRLTEVMRQRDATERRLLARVHAGEPNAYVRHKLETRALRRFGSGGEATQALVADWWAAQSRLPYGEAVMISRDNATRERLNAAARERLRETGRLGEAVELGGREFAVGDRVIARRNDRGRDLDNGMRATVRAVNPKSGELVVETDASGVRELPASYAREHLEHAYALTGHGLQGGTVEWAGVAGIPSDFSRNWSYTALSRARGETRIYLVDEASRAAGLRAEIAPADGRSAERPARVRMERAMRVRDDEPLALDHFDPPALPSDRAAERGAPIAEAHAERAAPPPEVPADAARMRAEIAELGAKLDAFPTALAKRLDEARAERLGAEKIAEAEKRLAGLGSASAAERALEEQRLEEARRTAKRAAKAERELAPQMPNREAWEREAAPLRERRTALVEELRARSESHAEAAVMAPGPHIVEALGSAPPDPAGRRSWERGVRAIERYRFEHGTSGEGPLGSRPERGEAARAWRDANDELVRAQRQLGRESGKSVERGR